MGVELDELFEVEDVEVELKKVAVEVRVAVEVGEEGTVDEVFVGEADDSQAETFVLLGKGVSLCAQKGFRP